MTKFAAWREIQRQRLAHWIYPERFAKGWTPRTVEEAVADHQFWLRHAAINAEIAEFERGLPSHGS